MNNSTNTGLNFDRLQNALSLQNEGRSTTASATEVNKQTSKGVAVINLYSSEDSHSSGDENWKIARKINKKPQASSPFAASAMKPVAKRPSPPPNPRFKPPPSNSSKNTKGAQVKDKNNRIHSPRLQLNGTLAPVEDHTTGTRWAIKGSWKNEGEPIESANPKHTFELVSSERSTSYSEPLTGLYSGHVLFEETTTTLKGKESKKLSTIPEKSVKLEFRKHKDSNKFFITGNGKNKLGEFILNGWAKPITHGQFSRSYVINLKKKYLDLSAFTSVHVRTNQKKTNTTAPSSTKTKVASSPLTLAIRAQAVPGPKRTATTSPNDDSSRPKKKQKKQKAPESNSETESEASEQDFPSLNYPTSSQQIPTSTSVDESNVQNPPIPSQLSTTSTGVDKVNGRGMWHAWTRSFDTPLLALLDLFDNAVDASWALLPNKQGPIPKMQKPKICVDIDRYGRNGVVMRNASTSIPPLHQVLQVYKSSKAGEGDNSIGENGIGVKHACASLSGLSFVFTKTTDPNDGSCTLSMGILMQELQRDDGIVLPSMAFSVDDSREGSLDKVQEALERHCEENPHTWGKAVKEYGDDQFEDGIERCLSHMDHLRGDKNWRDSENVFAVVLASLKHAAFEDDEDDDSEMEVIRVDGIEKDSAMARRMGLELRNTKEKSTTTYHTVHQRGDTDVDEDLQRSLSLLNTLKAQLPYLYLHLHDLDIRVEKKAIESIYWERRLTELSKFELQLPQTEHWSKPKKVREGEVKTGNETNEVFNITKPEETIRFFCGFDPYRCRNKQSKGANNSCDNSDDEVTMSTIPGEVNRGGRLHLQGNNSALKVYLYSRQSGRLIKVQNDPRSKLRISSGSTDFCQGLTVIIDDHNGTLPLNPTKQDTAYGHSKHGQIHKENLQEWTAAVSDFYWKYYYEQFGCSKMEISTAVANSKANLERAYKEYGTNKSTITPLCRGRFITYRNVEFKLATYFGNTRIRASKASRDLVEPLIGKRSVISRLECDPELKQKRANPTSESFSTTPGKKMTELRQEQQQQEMNVLRTTNEHLNAQLLQFQEYITKLEVDKKRLTDETLILKNHLQKRDLARARDEQEIRLLNKERERLAKDCKDQTEKAHQYRIQLTEAKQRGSMGSPQPGSPQPGSPQPSQQPSSIPTTASKGERGDVANLTRQINIYKPRYEFYKNESQAKQKQINALMEEKSRFENRIQELEEAQLALESFGDNSALQF